MAGVNRIAVPSGGASAVGFIQVAGGGAYGIQGSVPPPGPIPKVLILQALGDLSVLHEAVGAPPENRITTPSGSSIFVLGGQSLILVYNVVTSRWVATVHGTQI